MPKKNNESNKITRPYLNDPTNRWLIGLTNEEHHALPALSSTAIKCFYKRDPWTFYEKHVLRNSGENEKKDEFKIGTLIHLAIFEPDVFHKTVFICDDAANTIKYKEFRSDLLKNFCIKSQNVQKDNSVILSKNGGYNIDDGGELFIIKSRDMNMLNRIIENIKNHEKIYSLIMEAKHREQSGIAQCPNTGLFLSCRGDARSDLGYFIDGKSISDLSIHSMDSAQSNYSYFLSQAHYIYVANMIEKDKYAEFYYIYISKEFPHEVCLVHLDDDSVKQSNKIYFEILKNISECEYNNKWPTLDNGNGLLLKLPIWIK